MLCPQKQPNMKTTKIEWTEATWNPSIGCSKVTAGCKNCYAKVIARRLKAYMHEILMGFSVNSVVIGIISINYLREISTMQFLKCTVFECFSHLSLHII
jgi:protein gp37